MNPLCNDYYTTRALDMSADLSIPGYFGGDWGVYGLHFPGDLRCFEHWKGPRRLTIGPPVYLDRPLYQYAYESLRWFDYWLKGVDTKMLEEPPVNVFIVGTNEWKSADDWPLPGTRWTPFYLHSKGLLSEHEYWPNEGFTTYEDSPFGRGAAMFRTSPMVENTEICGPVALNLYASTTDTEVYFFVSLWHIAESGKETLLTRGWLRGSQRRIDPAKSKPWQPHHLHTAREKLKPDEIAEFNIEIRPYGLLVEGGRAIGAQDHRRRGRAGGAFARADRQGPHPAPEGVDGHDSPQRRPPVASAVADHEGQPHRHLHLGRQAAAARLERIRHADRPLRPQAARTRP